MDLFVPIKRHSQFGVLDPPTASYGFAHPRGCRQGVKWCMLQQQTAHLFVLLFSDRLGGRKTEGKNSWQDNERKAAHLRPESTCEHHCYCSVIRMLLLYL